MNKLAELKTDWESRDSYVCTETFIEDQDKHEQKEDEEHKHEHFPAFPWLLRLLSGWPVQEKKNGGFRACQWARSDALLRPYCTVKEMQLTS